MRRTTRPGSPRRHALSAVVLVLAATTSSVAAADDGVGPLGVTVDAPATWPTARVGALFRGTGGLAGGHFCTASVVHSEGRNLIVSAAHCLDGGGRFRFAPGYRDGRAPYGVWDVGRTYVAEAWRRDRDEDSDLAFAVVDDLAGLEVEDVVGGSPLAIGQATGATAVTVTGYPRSREVPVTCTARPSAHSGTQQRVECPGFTGGTSGSPWVNGDGRVVGVIGGHEEGGNTADVSYSVVLGEEAAALHRTASAER
ncbi:trypsin-like serine peptidase [Streptomyces sp. NPDC002952]|uniref:trypsin-like serine peptidase n=1 Tax=Streptomyces sp. NPDC002952 TaxID=3364673 RepID=UPI0036AE59DF